MTMHLKYLQYVLRHKWYVFLACLRYGLIWQGITHDWSKFLPSEWLPYAEYFYGLRVGARVCGVSDNCPFEGVIIEERDDKESRFKVRLNDGSQEFWMWTYEIDRTQEKAAFDEAWNHHQKRQPHHWQYWLLTMDTGKEVVLPMPDQYCKEMLADWRGASKAITGADNTLNWYKTNYKKMRLHPETRTWIEHELGLYAEEGWGLHYDGIERAA